MPIFLLPIIISLIFAENSISSNDLFEFENKFYLANSYKTYSGQIIDYHSNGMIKIEGNIDQGQKSGNWFEFYSNGSLKSQMFYNKNKVKRLRQ